MLHINRQTDYAIRVVLALSKRPVGKRVATSENGREMIIHPSLVQRIVADLARGDFIHTYPGRDGGITLARPPEEINLPQVIEHLQGKVILSDCLVAAGECPFDNECPVRCRWIRLQSMILQEMEFITFSELAQEAQSGSNRVALDIPHSQVQT